MKTKIILSILVTVLMFACKKENVTPPNNYQDGDLHITIVDNQTGNPISGANVTIAYGNNFSDAATTGVDGKVSFSIFGVLNEIHVTKGGYCLYSNSPNTTSYSLNQTIGLNHYAYLRYHVKNEPPSLSNDKLVIYSPNPTNLYYGYEFIFYGATVDSTFITPAIAGNLGISCNIFTGNTFISSFNVNVIAIAGDTVDVTVNY